MPTIFRLGPYSFGIFRKEGNEPPHVHVRRDQDEAKFWLEPLKRASSQGFAEKELRRIERVVAEHRVAFRERYRELHNR